MQTAQSSLLDEIRARNDELERAVRARDVVRLVEGACADDAVLLPADQPVAVGRVQIAEAAHAEFRAGLRDARLQTIRVDASGELVCEVGKYSATYEVEGVGPVEDQGRYLTVYLRQSDGSLQVIAAAYGGELPRP